MLMSEAPGSRRTPLLDEYLESLPERCASYPDHQVRASLTLNGIAGFRIQRDELPPPLRYLLDTPPTSTSWIPEVHNLAVWTLVRDLRFDNDQSFFDAVVEIDSRIYNNVVYRTLFWALRPARILKLGGKAFEHFRKGSELITERRSNRSVTITLRYPRGLFSELMWEAVLAGSTESIRVGNPEETIVGRSTCWTPHEARGFIEW